MSTGNYELLAIQGRQGSFNYYLTQIPIKLATKILLFDETSVSDAIKAIQQIDKSEIAELEKYILNQTDEYVLSPVLAITDADLSFDIEQQEPFATGRLSIPLHSDLYVVAGQHIIKALQNALQDKPEVGNDDLPLMIITQTDRYADIHKVLHQASFNRSQRVLHDTENDISALVRDLVSQVPLFKDKTEIEKTSISNRSKNLFTLSAVHQATKELLGVSEEDTVSELQKKIAFDFWHLMSHEITEWRGVIEGELRPAYLRKNFIHAHTVTLIAIARIGHELISENPENWESILARLDDIDWSRDNSLWQKRAMTHGRMSKSNVSIKLTVNALKKALGLPLSEAEIELEKSLEN